MWIFFNFSNKNGTFYTATLSILLVRVRGLVLELIFLILYKSYVKKTGEKDGSLFQQNEIFDGEYNCYIVAVYWRTI